MRARGIIFVGFDAGPFRAIGQGRQRALNRL
jgi:hypothetical protein